jgi:cytochrome c-type biogenesis protein CcmH/NrfG
LNNQASRINPTPLRNARRLAPEFRDLEMSMTARRFLIFMLCLMVVATCGPLNVACAEQQDDARKPIGYDAFFQHGLRSLAAGDAASAIRDFYYLCRIFVKDAHVRYQLARAYLLSAKGASAEAGRNAVKKAEDRLTEAIKLDPHFDQAIVLLAELKMGKANLAAAVDLLAPLIKESPQNAPAQYLLATAYLAQQQTDQALAVYGQMTELFPDDPQPSFLMGTILMARRQLSEARQSFERCLEISPDYLPAEEKLIDLNLAETQYASALDRVQKRIDKNPNVARAWALRGKIYLAQRDFTRAEPDLLKAIMSPRTGKNRRSKSSPHSPKPTTIRPH